MRALGLSLAVAFVGLGLALSGVEASQAPATPQTQEGASAKASKPRKTKHRKVRHRTKGSQTGTPGQASKP
jgi:hypothetical protein